VAIEWLRCTPQAYVLRNKKLCSTFILGNNTGGVDRTDRRPLLDGLPLYRYVGRCSST
jgi:hypothetical protein